MHTSDKYKKAVGISCLAAFVLISAVAAVDMVRYILLGSMVPLVSQCFTEVILVLIGLLAWQSRLPVLLVLAAAVALPVGIQTNYLETTLFNFGFFVQAGIALLAAAAGSWFQLSGKTAPRRPKLWSAALLVVILAGGLAFWQGNLAVARSSPTAGSSIWAVPECFTGPAAQEGTVEELTYTTKAYATDEREVDKTAYVYLPSGYDPNQDYNILYLLHGTGDSERSWLLDHPENKEMVDQLIEQGVIDPLIIVTPTFYVEEDCAGNLDALTYSFVKELRNDLMPAVESRYSTYAASADDQGFADSRDHRAFAGLSRGAVTTYHSVLCGSLDYFSWFGTFSGCRTTAEYFQQTLQSEQFGQYPIHYLYATSGTMDFAMPGQVQDYHTLLEIEPRLTEGENTAFDIFPMQSHSWTSWNLALYNFLQRIF